MPADAIEPDSAGDPVRRPQAVGVHVLLLAWPFVPLALSMVLLGPPLIMAPSTEPPAWRLLPLRLAAPWFLAGMLLGAGVLRWRPPDRLTRRDLRIAAVSIGLNAAWAWLCWIGGYRLPWPYAF